MTEKNAHQAAWEEAGLPPYGAVDSFATGDIPWMQTLLHEKGETFIENWLTRLDRTDPATRLATLELMRSLARKIPE